MKSNNSEVNKDNLMFDQIGQLLSLDRDEAQFPTMDELERRRFTRSIVEHFNAMQSSSSPDENINSIQRIRLWTGRHKTKLFVAASIVFAVLGTIFLTETFFTQVPSSPTPPMLAEQSLTTEKEDTKGVLPQAVSPEKGVRFSTQDTVMALSLNPNTIISAGKKSELVIGKTTTNTDEVLLEKGSLFAKVKTNQGKPVFRVKTRAGTIIVTGTVFAVDVTPNHVAVELFKGEVILQQKTGIRSVLKAGTTTTFAGTNVLTINRNRIEAALASAKFLSQPSLFEDGPINLNSPLSFQFENPYFGAPQSNDLPEKPKSKVNLPKPKGLLTRAQNLRSKRKWHQAADAYKLLIKRYPQSAEAQIALISIGSIELDKLNRPQLALKYFKRYLKSRNTGTLSIEAAWGKVLAYEKLRLNKKYRTSLESFIASYPNAIQADQARQKLNKLSFQ